MKHRFLSVLLAAALGALACVAPSSASAEESALGNALGGEAKALYEMGRGLFDKGDVAAALGRFTRAHELSKDPRLLWNVAACEASLKHYARAMTAVDRYLAASGSLLTERDRDQATRFRAAARPLVASVKIVGAPGPLTVAVDGEPVGATPLSETLYLDAGAHRVHFTKPGFRGVVRVESVAGGADVAWTVTLERLKIRTL